ncbi:hypothetical protein F5Y16DRAFT_404572 [Xylariaceae sp. FL0255]|nr:hypothetical protein F5Y16DRAFT_404572 [Xylariaceae sp. FL0255]
MQYTVVIFALLSVAMGQMVKVPRASDIQNTVKVQAGAMTDAQGNVVPFDAANVYKAATAQGI